MPLPLRQRSPWGTQVRAGAAGGRTALPPAQSHDPAAPPACPAEPRRARTLLQSLGELVGGLYAKYWIYVCAGMFVVVSFAGRLVVYKIVYMLLFLLCLTLFQVRPAAGGVGRGPPRPGLTPPRLTAAGRSTTACGGSC